MLGSFIRLFFGQQKVNHAGDAPPQDRLAKPGPLPHADSHGLPEVSATCWRRLILGETEIITADISLRFLLKNNVRYVNRASGSEEAIADRIHITRNFFIKNRLALDAEIAMLDHIEGERA